MVYIDKACYISTENEQIRLTFKESGECRDIPAEDLGFLVLDNYQVTITTNAINKIGDNQGAIITCGKNHHPLMSAHPIVGSYLQTDRLRKQIKATVPMLKNLWTQLIKAKIKNQAILLNYFKFDCKYLNALSDKVKSGDSTNREAVASRHYWGTLFRGTDFRRDPDGDYPNDFLNYGYSILRAAMARAIVNSGHHPSIGIHHKNIHNPFCLVDDLMEPYRPVVDLAVYSFYLENPEYAFLDRNAKKLMLGLIYTDVRINDKTHPLMTGIQETCTSLSNFFAGKVKKLKLPDLCV